MQYRKLTEIKKFDNNPRYIKKEDMDKLVKSIKNNPDYFEARPIILSDRTGELIIIAGNQRYEAAKIIGLTEVPTYLLKDLTEEREKEIMIRDNVSNGEWDWELLSSQFEKEELEDWGMDIDKDWQQEEIVEDEAPEVDEVSEPISKLGEVYQLGRHRLMCGDSTKIEDVEKLMDGQKADMVFTDPPYGVSLNKTLSGSSDKYEELENDDLSSDDLLDFNRKWLTNINIFLKDWGTCYLFYSSNKVIEIRTICLEIFKIKDTIIWVKDNFVLGRNDYKPQYEPILYLEKIGKGNVNRIWNGGFNKSNVWKLDRDKSLKKHPTQKPIELISFAVKNSSNEGNFILDLFGGSGSTLIACEQTNRTCYMMELDEKYCDVIRKRYAKFINSEDWESVTPKIL